MKCWTCKNQQSLPGDSHISCSNPPETVLLIGSGGNERYGRAEKIATDKQVVVRCIWPGSGWYPLCFDGNTVFGCCNYMASNLVNEATLYAKKYQGIKPSRDSKGRFC